MSQKLPFGMLFEERVDAEELEITPIYDIDESVSYVNVQNGRMPFIEWEWDRYAGTKTGTGTKELGDSEDTDEDLRITRTRTITEVKENTDKD